MLRHAPAAIAMPSANFAAGCVGLFAPAGVAISALGLDSLHVWDVQAPILYTASSLTLASLALTAWRLQRPLPFTVATASVAALLYPLHEALDVTTLRVLMNGGAAGLLAASGWGALLLRRQRAR